jgi:hypothetical protein
MPKKNPKRIGLAIIGAGRVGLFRGEVAARHPQVDFIGLAEIKPDRAKGRGHVGADFVTDYREPLARPEVIAAIIATDEHLHVVSHPGGGRAEAPMLIEKPLATDLADSERAAHPEIGRRRGGRLHAASAGAGSRRRKGAHWRASDVTQSPRAFMNRWSRSTTTSALTILVDPPMVIRARTRSMARG